MRRLANPFTVAVISLVAQGGVATAQTGTTRVMVRGTIDTVVRVDSSRIATTRLMLLITLPKIDSLVRLQDTMTIGSPEYLRIDDELRAAIRATLPTGVRVFKADSTFSITLIPPATGQMRRPPLAVPRVLSDVEPRGWIGIRTEGVYEGPWTESDGSYIHYFVYPIVVAVDANSPAAKVGVQFGDSLLAYDGLDLRRNAINLTRLLEPGRTLKVKLRRDGETKDISIIPEKIPPSMERERQVTAVAGMLVPSRTLVMIPDSTDRRIVEKRAQASAGGRGGGTFVARAPVAMMVVNSILGARMTDLESAAILALTQHKTSHGVLVTEVPTGSPAARMGLRGADMIIAVGDLDVISVSQLFRELSARGPNRATQFVVLREGKTEKLTYEPRLP